jgi:hypothetical protein
MVEKKTLPIIHSNYTKTETTQSETAQTETLPNPSSNNVYNNDDNNKVDTTTNTTKDDKALGKKLLSSPPPNNNTVKTKSTPLKTFAPVKKKTVVKSKVPARTLKLLRGNESVTRTTTGAISESGSNQVLLSLEREDNAQLHVEQEVQEEDENEKEEQPQQRPTSSSVREEEENESGVQEDHTDDNDTSMYDEPLPGLNTVTPPTKSRDPKVLHVPNSVCGTEQSGEAREVREELPMSHSMNVDKRAEGKPRKKPEQLSLQQNKAMVGSVATFSKKSPPSLQDNEPPIVHRPDEFDPESIDTICAEIYERKQQNGCAKFPLCLCNQTPCAKKSLTSSLRLKKTSSYQEMI